ncbi:MAG: endonuclease MutS2 [Nitrospinaceae bacterium]|nr:MAG: endonuclease MutS2 [Nitrospinaceae bacterium]
MIPSEDLLSESGKTRLLNKSYSQLGWELIQNALASRTSSPVTASLCREMLPESDFESAERALAETTEMVLLLESGEPFPLNAFQDIRPLLQEAYEKNILESNQCLEVLKLLRLCRALKKALDKKTDTPLLQTLSLKLDSLPALLKEIEKCISDEGEIKENASPELKQAIREVATAKQNLQTRMAKLFSTANFKEALQDSYFTEREERLVVPVRAEYRSRVEGIVHDSSGSGQTLFVEPTQIIPLNNQFKICKLKVDQEKFRILQGLASQIAMHQALLLENLEALTQLDRIHAKARLAKLMNAKKCPMNREGNMNLTEARNPELILNKQKVIPNDISWDASTCAIIISGPNTGGKTVTLKTIGLMSMMVRAGLFLPVREGSAISFFPEVYADIGDDQNIQLNLSTFSGHLQKIILILHHARPGSLILLDELGIATDPFEGAALAEAILLELKRREVVTLVSTHYLSLKMLAQTQEGFLNACTEFDPDSMTPTYRLIFGVPGHSAALDTAQRLGLASGIIASAREIYDAKDNRAENLLQNLTQQKLQLEQTREAIQQQSEEINRLKEEQNSLTEKLRSGESEFEKNKKKRLQSYLREAKFEIRKLLQEIKGSKDAPKIRRVEKQIRAMGQTPLSANGRDFSGWELPPDKLGEGDQVLVETYGALGVLLENPKDKAKVRVKLGNLTTWVETQNLKGHARNRQVQKTTVDQIQIKVQSDNTPQAKTSCDLRGMNSEQALEAMEQFLSQAVVNKVHHVKIIHGHGMGTIKQLTREFLETTGMCKNFHPGSREEGGDGITVVEL